MARFRSLIHHLQPDGDSAGGSRGQRPGCCVNLSKKQPRFRSETEFFA
ncbi:MAG: hypothetical protein HC849_12595 [Oscillatoriales cyanobacterium RU_3_3]|nr:hypothetical protein [Oscillatoriales cyanobacterium RU_3_3]